jgi:hypothetical protein
MPFSHAALTIRVSGTPSTAARDLLEQRALGYCHVDNDLSGKIKSLFKSSSSSLNPTVWRSDDMLNGLTILYTAPKPDLESASHCS